MHCIRIAYRAATVKAPYLKRASATSLRTVWLMLGWAASAISGHAEVVIGNGYPGTIPEPPPCWKQKTQRQNVVNADPDCLSLEQK